MNSLKLFLNFFLKLFFNPKFVELANHTDYVQLFDDNGDLVIIFGRHEHNPHELARDCIKTIFDMIRGEGILQTDKGRLVLTIFRKKK